MRKIFARKTHTATLAPCLSMLALPFLFAGAAAPAHGDTIISVSGTANTFLPIGPSIQRDLASAWTSTGTFSGVSISALLTAETQPFPTVPRADVTGQAFLVTAIGPGATVATQVATASFFIPSTLLTPTPINLFSGLTLGPGTYYLVLAGPATLAPNFDWVTAGPYTTVTDPGTTPLLDQNMGGSNTSYPPANSFIGLSSRTDRLQYSVTGTPVTGVPEPSTFVSLAVGVLGICWFRRTSVFAVGFRRKL